MRMPLISELVLFTQNSISLEALHVCVIVKLSHVFFLMHGSNKQLALHLTTLISISNFTVE